MSSPSELGTALPSRALTDTLMVWIRAGRLPLPEHFVLEAGDLGAEPLPPPPEGEVVHSSDFTEFRVPRGGGMHARWLRAPAQATIDPVRPAVTIEAAWSKVAGSELFFREFMLYVLALTLKRGGLYQVHAAAATDREGEGWLLVGQTRSGKSTTSAHLARCGWRVASDDQVYLRVDGECCRAFGWREPIALRDGGRELIGASGGTVLERRGKTGYTPADLGGEWQAVVVPRYLAIPVIGSGPSRLEPISGREAFRTLMAQSLWILFESAHADAYLNALALLIGQTQAFRLHLGPDFLRTPDGIRTLLSR